MTGDRLYTDPRLARLYDHDNPWRADTAFCHALAARAPGVLDLGCGIGMLAAAIARDHGGRVTGVDPADAMLDIARARGGGDLVDWIAGDARSLRLDRRFDLIVMTGHAFQTLLTDADRAAALATIAHHLAPEGRFIFDSRNPARREWQAWQPGLTLETRDLAGIGRVTRWNDVDWDEAGQIAAYGKTYLIEATGERLSARSRIAFPAQPLLARQIADAGLQVDRWLGDWQGNPFTPGAAEIIPLGRRA